MLAALALTMLLASLVLASALAAAAAASAAATPPAPALAVAAASVLLLAALVGGSAAPAALGLLTGRLVAAPAARRVRPRRAALSRRLFVHHLYYPLEIFAPVHISSAPGNSPAHRESSAFSA